VGKREKGLDAMIPEIRYLTVYAEEIPVGRLATSKNRLSAFEYNANWLSAGYSVSPFLLPLESGLFTAPREPFDGLFGVFNDSLPDGWGNLLIDRWLKENGVNPGSMTWIERLAIVGDSGMGALRYEPEIEKKENNYNKSLDYYAEEVNKILHDEEVESLDHWVERAGSPGGARPKVLLEIDGKEWLIKFGAQGDPEDIGEIEFRYSQSAKLAGIEMPETRLFEGKYFGTTRFDRENGRRIHMITASGLLHASHRYPSLDYTDLMKAAFHLTSSIIETKKLYRLMVFNVLTFNKDDHAKNFSFLYKNSKWICSPAYDLVYSSGFNDNHSTTVNGKGNPTKEDVLKSGVEAGLNHKECLHMYEEVEANTKELIRFLNDRFR
jgi:serine/threonine-protein kinase HipA